MKRAIVTGGTRGIGFATCQLLQEKGYEVVALYSKEGEAAERAKAQLKGVTFLCVDVTNLNAVKNLFSQYEQIDLLVNNAGVSLVEQIQDTTEEAYERLMSVNLKGAYFCAKYAAKRMISAGKGAIVNVSSVWGQTGGSCETAYSASKGGLISFTKALAKELAPSQITVNCVAPGVIDTEMNAQFTQEERAALCEEIPLGRMGLAHEVATAILFLAEHGYITGEVLGVNGGFYI